MDTFETMFLLFIRSRCQRANTSICWQRKHHMYSRIHRNEEFRDEFLIYHDIFAVRTRCVRRENGNSISEMQPKWLVLRRYREYIISSHNQIYYNWLKYNRQSPLLFLPLSILRTGSVEILILSSTHPASFHTPAQTPHRKFQLPCTLILLSP